MDEFGLRYNRDDGDQDGGRGKRPNLLPTSTAEDVTTKVCEGGSGRTKVEATVTRTVPPSIRLIA